MKGSRAHAGAYDRHEPQAYSFDPLPGLQVQWLPDLEPVMLPTCVDEYSASNDCTVSQQHDSAALDNRL